MNDSNVLPIPDLDNLNTMRMSSRVLAVMRLARQDEWVTSTTIADVLGEQLNHVAPALHDLWSKGMLVRQSRKRSDGDGAIYEYRLPENAPAHKAKRVSKAAETTIQLAVDDRKIALTVPQAKRLLAQLKALFEAS